MSNSSFKNTVTLITMSIFEKNAHVAVYQNISRIDSFKFLNPNGIRAKPLKMNFAKPEPKPEQCFKRFDALIYIYMIQTILIKIQSDYYKTSIKKKKN